MAFCPECRRAKCPAGCPNCEPAAVTHCDACRVPLMDGDEAYVIDGLPWCEDCAQDWLGEMRITIDADNEE